MSLCGHVSVVWPATTVPCGAWRAMKGRDSLAAIVSHEYQCCNLG